MVSAQIDFPLTGVGSRFDTGLWDTARWGGQIYTMDGGHWEDRPYGDKVRLTLTHTSTQPFAIKELAATMHVLGRIVK